MSKRTNIIFNVLTIVLTAGAIFCVAFLANNYYVGELIKIVGFLILGTLVASIINAFAHELGHFIAGKVNGFALVEMSVWFFKFTRFKGKFTFEFTLPREEIGYTEMVPFGTENMGRRYKRVALGGAVASAIITAIGIVPLFLTAHIPFVLYAFWTTLFPVGLYYFLGAILPIQNDGVDNDGLVAYKISKNHDDAKVTLALLCVQAELVDGKTYAEIDEKYLFDLPQLAEDDIYFAMLLNARYNYYLDKGDYENAKKITERLLGLEEYLPKAFLTLAKADALYNACTFDFNEDVADDIFYELEKYLNKRQTATNMRIKTAYLAFVLKNDEQLNSFIEGTKEEIADMNIAGLSVFESRRIAEIEKRLIKENETID